MIRISIPITCAAIAAFATIGASHAGGPAVSGVDRLVDLSSVGSLLESEIPLFNVSDEFHGVARASRYAELPSLVPGTIRTIHVREGQTVRQGAPLITLDDRVPQAQLASATLRAGLTGAVLRAEVECRVAESRLKRVKQVVNRGAGANFELEEATAARDKSQAALQLQRDTLNAAEADRLLAQARLDQYTISAPFDGVITEIHQQFGAVDASVPLITIANLTTLDIEMHLPSRLFGSVCTGQTLRLQAGRPVTKAISATVVSVSPIINSTSDTFRCLLQLQNQDGRLPGGFCVVLDPETDDAAPDNRAVATARVH